MKEEIKNTPTPLSADPLPAFNKPKSTSIEQLQRDCGYYKSQQLLQNMLDCGLISLSEFNKITLLNRETFSPFLVEIMPKTTG